MAGFSLEQVKVLLQPIRPSRVLKAQDQSHIPAYDVTAHLTRVFGFGGWDKKILSLTLVCEDTAKTSGGKDAWRVTYSCTMRLTVKDRFGNTLATYDDGACGSAMLPQRGEAHDMAMKSAISYALKRCAKDLGDQFGLSLYNKGSLAALVGKTLVMPVGSAAEKEKTVADIESHIPEPKSLGNDETDYGRPFE